MAIRATVLSKANRLPASRIDEALIQYELIQETKAVMKTVGDYIREARARYGLSQRDVAKLLGGYSVAPIESGFHLPSPEAAKKIASVLRLPPEFLARLEETKTGKDLHPGLIIVGSVLALGSKLALDGSAYPLSEVKDLRHPMYSADSFAIRMGDPSMAPNLKIDDLAIASRQSPYLPGDTVLAGHRDGRCFVRVIDFDMDAVVLSAHAPAFPTLRFDRQEIAFVLKIVGVFFR